ncbi:acetate--CoA ligase family protein [Bordetella petrii]|uniref:Acetate--CoA ligase family protein n=1 Tax=Bordetella petrii TaxID=94624 RepID=A0ABT7W0P1_9BORD|nr:acetate--CoA ligase family protein [Bordetella petrii]MDM9558751.1 acetate--CoA ligase family protein [Bordetella petrii]
MASNHPLHRLFEPRHVALLGVSRDTSKAGYKFLRSLLDAGYQGKISLLGRQAGELEGLQIHTSPDALPGDIDVAFNLLGPAQTPEVLKAVAARGTAFSVVFTSGFAEMGAAGAALQDDMVRTCNASGMRIVGPNCMGLFNLHLGLNLTEISPLPAGTIAMVSQSGNVGVTLWDQARKHDVGFSCFVGFGNQADIPIHEYIDYLGQHEATKVIVVYLEGLRPGAGDAFFRTCSRVSRLKPIVALKGGRTDAGRRAAESHTASLSSSERVYAALFEEAGVIEVSQMEHMLPVAEALMRCPPMRGEDVAIVGSGGGHSTVCTDEVESAGLRVPAFSEDLQQELGRRLPAWAPKRNPVDMTGAYTSDPSLFASLTGLVMQHDAGFSAAVNYGLYGLWKDGKVAEDSEYDYETAAPLIGQLQARLDKPIVFYTPYADRPHPSFTAMREAGVPCLDSVAAVGAALAALRKRGRYLARDVDTHAEAARTDEPAARPPAGASQDYATEVGAYALLARHGVKVPEVLTASDADQAVAMAERLGYPVVLKAVLPGVAHKSDVGGVRTGLGDATAVRRAADDISRNVAQALGSRALAGLMVASDLGRRRELIVGVRRDVSLRTLGLVGLGGVLAEALNDVAVCLLPATPQRVERALARLKSARAWAAFRGEPAVPADAIAALLNQLQAALLSDPAIASVECNPVMVIGDRVVPVDAAIAMHDKE